MKRERADRIERIAERRTQGESLRTIAKEEGVSPTQVRHDLEAASGVQGCTPEPATGQVVGANGRPQAARKKPTVLCERCDRVGAVENCKACAEASKKAKERAKAEKEAEKAKANLAKFDDADEEVEDDKPESIEDIIKRKNGEIESFCRQAMKFVKDNFPKDEWLDDLGRGAGALKKFEDACATLRTAKCHAPCPKCEGGGCKSCRDTGRLPKLNYDQVA
jgi:hypothetical protein